MQPERAPRQLEAQLRGAHAPPHGSQRGAPRSAWAGPAFSVHLGSREPCGRPTAWAKEAERALPVLWGRELGGERGYSVPRRQTDSQPCSLLQEPQRRAGSARELELPEALRSSLLRNGRTLHELSVFPVLARALLPRPLSSSPLGACLRGLAPCPSAAHMLPDSAGIKEALKGSLIHQPEHSSSPLPPSPRPSRSTCFRKPPSPCPPSISTSEMRTVPSITA